jgi:hypothetical protein
MVRIILPCGANRNCLMQGHKSVVGSRGGVLNDFFWGDNVIIIYHQSKNQPAPNDKQSIISLCVLVCCI